MAERLLVVAPHPDDESLGAAGLIAKERQRGAEVFVALATLGDGFMEDAARYYLSLEVKPEEYLHMGYERQAETIRAMAELGVEPDHLFFLGFPDGGLDSLWRTHWDHEAWTSGTTGYNAVPYLMACKPDTPYVGQNILRLLMNIYEDVHPDRLVVPSAFDSHPDHWATNAFATLAWAEMALKDSDWEQVERWGYLVHWPTWPFPLAFRPEMAFEWPRSLLELGQEPSHAEDITYVQIEQKRRALLAHGSQAELIKPFMLAFCRRTEAFWQEHLWSPKNLDDSVVIRNPRSDWRARLVRKQNPLRQACWGRAAEGDFVEVALNDGLTDGRRLEICLHVVDGSHAHYQWMVGGSANAPAEVRWVMEPGVVRIVWPRRWIGSAKRVMAGIQLFGREKCEGKIPFRLVSWPG